MTVIPVSEKIYYNLVDAIVKAIKDWDRMSPNPDINGFIDALQVSTRAVNMFTIVPEEILNLDPDQPIDVSSVIVDD
jgi:hypothetical protein